MNRLHSHSISNPLPLLFIKQVGRRTELKLSLTQTDATHLHPASLYLIKMGGEGREGARKGSLVTNITSQNLYASTGPPIR